MESIVIHDTKQNVVLYVGADEFRAIEALQRSFTRNESITQDEALNVTIRNILQRKFITIPEHDILNIRITRHMV